MFEDLDMLINPYKGISGIVLALDGVHFILIMYFLISEDTITRRKLILYVASFVVIVLALIS